MKEGINDKTWISITLAFLGIIFIYDGFLDITRKKLSVIIGLIFVGISMLLLRFPKKIN